MQPLNPKTLWRYLKQLILICSLAAPVDSPVASETIYQWTNKAGTPCFSNVAPYGDRINLEALNGYKDNHQKNSDQPNRNDGSEKISLPPVTVKTKEIQNRNPTIIKEPGVSHITEKQKFIGLRIKKDEASIRAIEAMLTLKPGNQRLRKNLRQKQKEVQKDNHVLEFLKNSQ